jgi:hypothetical protein
MAKARKFTSLKAAHDWLVKRGFAATATQHVWKNGSRMAAISAELGGVLPKFLVAMGDCVFRSKSARHSDFMSATDSDLMSAVPI